MPNVGTKNILFGLEFQKIIVILEISTFDSVKLVTAKFGLEMKMPKVGTKTVSLG